MRIEHLLASKGGTVATIGPGASIREAVQALADHRIGALVVSSDGEHIEGILSERDIVRALNGEGADLLGEQVASIMSSTVYTCTPADDTDSLMATMTDRRIRHVPVVTGGVLVGIVSIGDIVKTRIDELEKDRKQLVDYIYSR